MTLYYVMIGIVVIATVSILSVTVLFNIDSFQVTGDSSYSEEEIIAASGINNGDNLIRINIGEAEEQIVSRLVYIDSAKISRGFPNRLLIDVEPAQPAISFACYGSFYVISERGRLLEISKTAADCPIVTGFVPALDVDAGEMLEDDLDGRISIALHMTGYLEQYGMDADCEINLTDTLNIILTYDHRVEMELGASTRLDDKLYYAGLLLDEEIGESEHCILILSNPERVVKRPVYDIDTDINTDDSNLPDDPESTSGPESTDDPESTDTA